MKNWFFSILIAKFELKTDEQYFEVPRGSGRPSRMTSHGISNDMDASRKAHALQGKVKEMGGQDKIPVEWSQALVHLYFVILYS